MPVPCKWIMKIIKDVAKNGHNNSKISSSRALWLICSCKSAAKGERVINRAEDCSRRQAALSLCVSGYHGSCLSPALPACCCQRRKALRSLSTSAQSPLPPSSHRVEPQPPRCRCRLMERPLPSPKADSSHDSVHWPTKPGLTGRGSAVLQTRGFSQLYSKMPRTGLEARRVLYRGVLLNR